MTLLVIASFLYLFSGWRAGYYFLGVIILGGIGLVMAVRAASLLFDRFFSMAIEVYDDGLVYRPFPYTHPAFVPWSQIADVYSSQSPGESYLMVFHLRWGQRIGIRRAGEGVEDLIPLVEERLKQRSDDDSAFDPASYMMRRFMWFKLASYGIALGIGILGSAYLATLLIPQEVTSDPRIYIILSALLFPAMFMPALTLVGLRIVLSARAMGLPRGMDIPAIITAAVLSMLIMGAGLTAGMYMSVDPTPVRSDERPSDNWLLSNHYSDQELVITGNIVVDPGMNVSFDNCTLTMRTDDGPLHIWVSGGGGLSLHNSTLCSNAERGYSFEVHGSALISGCNISGIWGDTGYPNGDGGLEIYNDSVTVENSRIHDCKVNGLLCVGCSPTLVNTTIAHCGDDGVELHSSNASIDHCIFYRNKWGLTAFEGSAPTVNDTVFLENSYGIAFERSNPHITNCTFAGTENAAIQYGSLSDPVFHNNTFRENDTNIDDNAGLQNSSVIFICIPAGLTIIFSSAAGLVALEMMLVRKSFKVRGGTTENKETVRIMVQRTGESGKRGR